MNVDLISETKHSHWSYWPLKVVRDQIH